MISDYIEFENNATGKELTLHILCIDHNSVIYTTIDSNGNICQYLENTRIKVV